MSLTRLHFDTDVEVGETIKRKKRAQVQLVYIGMNKYNVKAIDLAIKDLKSPKAIICNKQIEYPALKGNGRKTYSKLRDIALNVIENKPLDYYRAEK